MFLKKWMREGLDCGLDLVRFVFFVKLTKRLLGGAHINLRKGQRGCRKSKSYEMFKLRSNFHNI